MKPSTEYILLSSVQVHAVVRPWHEGYASPLCFPPSRIFLIEEYK